MTRGLSWARTKARIHDLRRCSGRREPRGVREIARILNAEAIPARRGGPWSGEQVRRVLAEPRPDVETTSQVQEVLLPSQWLTKPQRDRIRQAAGRFTLEIEVLMATGLRRFELCGLKAGDVQVDGAQPVLVVRSGKGRRRPGPPRPGRPRSGGKRRVVALTPRLAGLLREHIEANHLRADRFLCRNSRGRPWKPDALGKMVKRVAVRAGLPHVHTHTFRHTFGTLCAQATPVVFFGKQMLGHSHLSTTEIYSHTVETQVSDALAKIDELL